MAGDVTQLNDIWSQSLTRGAAELRGFNYTNEHSIRRSQRQPGAAQLCHTGCTDRAHTHTHTRILTHICTDSRSHTLVPSAQPGYSGSDVGSRLYLSHTVSLSVPPLSFSRCKTSSLLYSPLTQLFLSPACSLSLYNCLENVCSMREITFDKCK